MSRPRSDPEPRFDDRSTGTALSVRMYVRMYLYNMINFEIHCVTQFAYQGHRFKVKVTAKNVDSQQHPCQQVSNFAKAASDLCGKGDCSLI